MNDLIKTFRQDNGKIAVDGRNLYDFLEVETKYSDWIKRMISYGFTENVDFSVFPKNESDATAFGGVRKITDHALTLDMAKELAMIQRTDKGKQARQYFIAKEQEANQLEKVQNMDSYMIDDPVLRATKWIDEEKRRQALSDENQRLQIPALLGNAVAGATESVPIGTFAKVLAQNGVDIGQNRLFGWLREHGYLIDHGRRHNAPTQRAIDLGVLEVRESIISTNHGNKPRFTPLVTGKGQQYFTNKFLKAPVAQ